MLDVNKIIPIFAEKLQRTGSFDDAMRKVLWIAYKQGIKDARKEKE
jgi:hypothetical protein